MILELMVPELFANPLPAWVGIARIASAPLVGWYAKRKGYDFWGFFMVTLLLNPLVGAVVALAIPRRDDGPVHALDSC